jgi:riboflavin synthase
MFTGLVLGRGRITARRPGRGEVSLTVEPAFDWEEPLAVGESVSVSGVCLTVTETAGPRAFSAYASAETLRLTTLGRTMEVNLERALRLSDRLGGHLVAGHVDGLGRVESLAPAGRSLLASFSFPPALAPFIAPKGSIAVDGVSLTVNEATFERLTVNLIPLTAQTTTLADLRPGREVNLETDLMARHIARLLEAGAVAPSSGVRQPLTLDGLAKLGF